jgi:hypothetical protein
MYTCLSLVWDGAAPRAPLQKCSRFQGLAEFQGLRRTCAVALAKQREQPTRRQRREAAAEAAAAAAASGGSMLTGGSSGCSSPPHALTPEAQLAPARGGAAAQSASTAAAAPKPAAPPPPALRQRISRRGGAAAAAAGAQALAPAQQADADSVGTLDDIDALLLRWTEPAALHCLALKLEDAAPTALPPAFGGALRAAWLPGGCAEYDDDSEGAGGDAACVALACEAAVRPGCTLLLADALLPAGGDAREAPHAAAEVAARLGAEPELAPLLAARARACAGGRVARVGGAGGAAADGGTAAPPPAPRLPPLRPAALLSTRAATLAPLPRGCVPPGGLLRARLHGQFVRLAAARRGAGRVRLPALDGAEGALLLEAWPGAAADFACHTGAPPRAVLLTRDVAIAAEVRAAAAAADARRDAAAGAALDAALPVLGAALRRGAGGGAPLLRAAAAQAARHGFAACLARLLPQLRAAQAEEAAEPASGAKARAATLLHLAARSGSVAAVQAVLSAGGPECAFGAATTPGPAGLTPLHLAAALHSRRGAAVARALTVHASDPDAWNAACDDAGASPAALAAALRTPAASLAPHEAPFVTWLARTNRRSVAAIASLQLCHFPTVLGALHVLGAPSLQEALSPLGFLPRLLVRTSVLYDIRTGAPVPLHAVPWPLVQRATRLLVAYGVCLRLPANAALLALAVAPAARFPRTRALYERWYEPLYVALNAVEMAHLPLVEYLAGYRAAGLVVDYSPAFAASYAIAALVLYGFGAARGTFGPCRAGWNVGVLLLRMVLFAGGLCWQRATWPAAARSAHVLTQAALLLGSLLTTRRNDARLRRLCAADLARARGGKAA